MFLLRKSLYILILVLFEKLTYNLELKNLIRIVLHGKEMKFK